MKPTLKHLQTNGTIATRQTARKYTHVLLRKSDGPAQAAAIRADMPAQLKRTAKEGREWYDYMAKYAAGVVGTPFIEERQGRMVTLFPFTQDMIDKGNAFLAANPNRTTFVAERMTEMETTQTARAAILDACRYEFEVISWHSRADLANPSYVGPGDEFLVEAINNGVRS